MSREMLTTTYSVQSRVDGTLLLDPSADEAYREDASALLAMMPSTDLVRYTNDNPLSSR